MREIKDPRHALAIKMLKMKCKGKSYKEIAIKYAVSENYAKTWIGHCMADLKTFYSATEEQIQHHHKQFLEKMKNIKTHKAALYKTANELSKIVNDLNELIRYPHRR